MVFELAAVILWALIDKSNVLDHVTGRIVNEFGRRPERPQSQPAQPARPAQPVPVYLEAVPRPTVRLERADDWVISPMPGQFIVLADEAEPSLVLAVVLDAVSGMPPCISWLPISLAVPVTASLPPNALAGIIARVPPEGSGVSPLRVDSCGVVNGCTVFKLRTERVER